MDTGSHDIKVSLEASPSSGSSRCSWCDRQLRSNILVPPNGQQTLWVPLRLIKGNIMTFWCLHSLLDMNCIITSPVPEASSWWCLMRTFLVVSTGFLLISVGDEGHCGLRLSETFPLCDCCTWTQEPIKPTCDLIVKEQSKTKSTHSFSLGYI